MQTIKMYTAYDLPVDPGIDFTNSKNMCQQQFGDEVNINTIIEKMQMTGTAVFNEQAPSYGDFSGALDYQSSLNRINQAQEEFMNLPAQIRRRFDDDVSNMLAFLEHEENRKEAEEIGLINKQETPAGAPLEGPPKPDVSTTKKE